MPARRHNLTTALLLILAAMMSGCAGGPIAQQIASSVATRVADKVVGDMVDAQLLRERQPRNFVLKDTEPDPYVGSFLLMQFPDVPKGEAVVEPLPAYIAYEQGKAAPPVSRLVTVDVLNIVIGREKQDLLERSRRNGSTILPEPIEWRDWQIATGSLRGRQDAQLYFLVPPDFGRMKSGDAAVVEIAEVGGLHIARYRAN